MEWDRRPLGRSHAFADACPHCGRAVEAMSGVRSDDRPRVGDFAVCIGCAGVAVVGADGRLRKATVGELAEIEGTEAGARLEVLGRSIVGLRRGRRREGGSR